MKLFKRLFDLAAAEDGVEEEGEVTVTTVPSSLVSVVTTAAPSGPPIKVLKRSDKVGVVTIVRASCVPPVTFEVVLLLLPVEQPPQQTTGVTLFKITVLASSLATAG